MLGRDNKSDCAKAWAAQHGLRLVLDPFTANALASFQLAPTQLRISRRHCSTRCTCKRRAAGTAAVLVGVMDPSSGASSRQGATHLIHPWPLVLLQGQPQLVALRSSSSRGSFSCLELRHEHQVVCRQACDDLQGTSRHQMLTAAQQANQSPFKRVLQAASQARSRVLKPLPREQHAMRNKRLPLPAEHETSNQVDTGVPCC